MTLHIHIHICILWQKAAGRRWESRKTDRRHAEQRARRVNTRNAVQFLRYSRTLGSPPRTCTSFHIGPCCQLSCKVVIPPLSLSPLPPLPAPFPPFHFFLLHFLLLPWNGLFPFSSRPLAAQISDLEVKRFRDIARDFQPFHLPASPSTRRFAPIRYIQISLL